MNLIYKIHSINPKQPEPNLQNWFDKSQTSIFLLVLPKEPAGIAATPTIHFKLFSILWATTQLCGKSVLLESSGLSHCCQLVAACITIQGKKNWGIIQINLCTAFVEGVWAIMHLIGKHNVCFSVKNPTRTCGPEGCFLIKFWIPSSS